VKDLRDYILQQRGLPPFSSASSSSSSSKTVVPNDFGIVLCANKSDIKRDPRSGVFVTQQEAKDFSKANRLILLETSGKTGDNAEEAIRKLIGDIRSAKKRKEGGGEEGKNCVLQ